MNITWSPPLPENQNGIITDYTVNITNIDTGEYRVIVTPNNTLSVLSLQPHTDYEIIIYALTGGGDGPATIPITVRTHEDGKTCICALHFTDCHLIHTIYLYSTHTWPD